MTSVNGELCGTVGVGADRWLGISRACYSFNSRAFALEAHTAAHAGHGVHASWRALLLGRLDDGDLSGAEQ